MTTKYDIAKGFSRRLSSAQAAGSVWQDPDAYNVRWGTVTAINEDGTVDVLLDGSETPITIELDYTVAVGDRISLSTQGGVYQAEPTGTMESSLEAKIAAEGARISAEVNADFEEFEATHDLSEYATTAQLEQTASSLSASVTGALETANASMRKATAMEADLSGVKTEVSTMFEEDGVGSKYVDSAIEQASGSITQTVTDSVTDSIGETYATKTLVQQTANSVKTTIESDVSDTYETKAHLATMITMDSNGVSVGKSSSSYKTVMTDNGVLIYNGTKLVATIKAESSSSVAFGYSNGNSSEGRLSLGDNTTTADLLGYQGTLIGDYYNSSIQYQYLFAARDSLSSMSGSYNAMKGIGAKILYSSSSGTNGTVTLNYSAANFEFIEIQYTDGSRYMTKRIYSPNYKYIALDRSVANTTEMFVESCVYYCSGTSLTRQANNQAQFIGRASSYAFNRLYDTTNGKSSTPQANLKIVNVIGWR